jgi:hypothetical protein
MIDLVAVILTCVMLIPTEVQNLPGVEQRRMNSQDLSACR